MCSACCRRSWERGRRQSSRGKLIELLIETRRELRQARAYDAADKVRQGLTDLGVQLQDGSDGTTWTLS